MRNRRDFGWTFLVFAGLVASPVVGTDVARAQDSRKEASDATKAANDALLEQLPFSDTSDFASARKGLVAPLPTELVRDESGSVVWDPTKFDFVAEGSVTPDTVNPSLWRQSQLVNLGGLFEVTDGIYQVRNQDLSNMTIIEGRRGIVVVDPLVSVETARVALDLYRAHRGDRPVKAVIYTHSHVDHYSGVRGVVDEADVRAGRVDIYAPEGFLDAAVSENVLAGNAMSRRASYMYGNLLPADPRGQVGAGLGMTTSAGTGSLIPPTETITHTGEKRKIDGLTYEFLLAPGSEAPAEMLWFMPEKKAIAAAEDCTHTLHNTYSLRGARIREPLRWSKYLEQALGMWGGEAEVMFAQHHWPTFGNVEVRDLLASQRDLYRYINDETLRLMNHGYTRDEIAARFALPDSLAKVWANRGYYGTVSHDVKATYVLYLGWFDGNPATLDPLPPVEASRRYVEYMGGAEAILTKAREAFANGEYRWVAEVVDHVVFADPDNRAARELQADTLEQLGYQAESGPWRNFYLTGAQELRHGVQKLPTTQTVAADTVGAMPVDMLLDYFSVRFDRSKAADARATIEVKLDDEPYRLELRNGVVNHSAGATGDDADATVALSRETLDAILLGRTTLGDALSSGDVTVAGDRGKVDTLISNLDRFDLWFDIVTPPRTDAASAAPESDSSGGPSADGP